MQTWAIIAVFLYFGRGMFGIFLPGPGNTSVYGEGSPNVSTKVSSVPSGGGAYAIGTQAPTPSPTPVTVNLNVIISTPIGAIVPTASATAGPDDGQIYDVLYSYYDPGLGGINCHTANWDGSHCADTTSSGIRWSQYMGSGVAVAPVWLQSAGYGTVIHVTSPEVMVGDYTIIDMCCGCAGGNWPDKKYRIDFLDNQQKLQWAYPIKFYIVSRTPGIKIGPGVCVQQ